MNGDFDETGGTKEPVSTGIDKLYPDDCGRDKDKGTGLLCFPDGELCKNSKSGSAHAQVPPPPRTMSHYTAIEK